MIVEVHEHQEIDVPIEHLLVDGELALDKRVSQRGYVAIAIAQGQLKLRATRFVGLIPLTKDFAVRIKPAASIGSLSQMIVRAGNVPAVVEGFARGYKPLFEQSAQAIELHHTSFLSAAERVLQRGLLKSYVRMDDPPKWRGRLLAAETVNRYVARGIRYGASFEFTTLSSNVPENRIIKSALSDVIDWLASRPEAVHRTQLRRAKAILGELRGISPYEGRRWRFAAEVPRLTRFLPEHQRYYAEALWAAYAILQRSIPDVARQGYASLDSMIVDVSAVFEAYVRTVMAENAVNYSLVVADGNRVPQPFFVARQSGYIVKPDILIERAGEVVAVLDVKYKPKISEQDRYELLSFMEATGAEHGAFVCPKVADGQHPLTYLGRTVGGKFMSIIRVDLASDDMLIEEERMTAAMLQIVDGKLG